MGYKEPPEAAKPKVQWQLFVFNQVILLLFLNHLNHFLHLFKYKIVLFLVMMGNSKYL